MIRTLKNITSGTIELTDFHGITLAPNETIDGLQFGDQDLRDSTKIAIEILHGNLSLSDGYNVFTNGAALDLIRGTSSQVTKDGKQIITSSDRPINTYRYYTAAGDDMANHIVGEGQELTFWTTPNTTEYKDIQFLEDVYIKDGQVHYWGVEDHSSFDVSVVVPAGVPFPAPTHQGNYDLTNGNWVANTNGTGGYYIIGVEKTIYRFVNKYLMTQTDGFGYIESPEPQLFPTPYKLRITVRNNNTTDHLRSSFIISAYRKTTI